MIHPDVASSILFLSLWFWLPVAKYMFCFKYYVFPWLLMIVFIEVFFPCFILFSFIIIFLFFKKIPRDLTEASLPGAGLSIIAAFSMIFLFGMVGSSFLFHWRFMDVICRSWLFIITWKMSLIQVYIDVSLLFKNCIKYLLVSSFIY